MQRPNFILTNTRTTTRYKSPQRGGRSGSDAYPRDRVRHAAKLLDHLSSAYQAERVLRKEGAVTRSGTYLDFRGPSDGELEALSLEDQRQDVRLLNVRQEGNSFAATVYVPAKKSDFYGKKIRSYADSSKDREDTGSPSNNKLITSVEDIRLADRAASFWTGNPESMPGETKQWTEVWLRYDKEKPSATVNQFMNLLDRLSIKYRTEQVIFPSRIVLLAWVNSSDLETIIRSSDSVAEFCEALEATGYLERADAKEQGLWVRNIQSRTSIHFGKSIVCILDSGVNSGHPLLEAAFEGNTVDSVDPSWGLADNKGHGTGVAGIALYGDLSSKVVSTEPISITHRLESVKIYEPQRPNDRELYAAIAQQGFDIATSRSYEENRIFCSAVTANEADTSNGKPTSWSAAVDAAISHPDNPDEEHELFLVSAGNVNPSLLTDAGYPYANMISPVRTPGQAWNALTVGAYSENAFITDISMQSQRYEPVAEHGGLSPFSSTSMQWDRPSLVKPEIMLDGGNAAKDDSGHIWSIEDLSPLSTGADVAGHPLQYFNATSAAVAKAAWMAAEIENAYPALWPETIRALLVHSARWSEAMINMFCPTGSERDRQSTGRRELLHACGYGIPQLDRAIECADNSVNLIIQDEMTPYECVVNNGRKKYCMKDMHLHHLPWPSDLLRELGDTKARLRVTLSYYIEPSPGMRGWKDRYRYASHGLRFDVNNPGETVDDFARRVNVNMRGEDEGMSVSGSKGWFLGQNNRRIGSIFSDFKDGTALDFSDIENVAVFPVIGWWRERHSENRFDSKARYSLVVSIETPSADVDLYSAIAQKIDTAAPIAINIPAGTH